MLQGGERGEGGDEGTGIRGVVYKGGKLKRRETDMDARWKERGEYIYIPIRLYVRPRYCVHYTLDKDIHNVQYTHFICIYVRMYVRTYIISKHTQKVAYAPSPP